MIIDDAVITQKKEFLYIKIILFCSCSSRHRVYRVITAGSQDPITKKTLWEGTINIKRTGPGPRTGTSFAPEQGPGPRPGPYDIWDGVRDGVGDRLTDRVWDRVHDRPRTRSGSRTGPENANGTNKGKELSINQKAITIALPILFGIITW